MPQVYTAIITPFEANGEIDYNLFEELVNWQTRIGIDGLVVCGTNGEFSSLSAEEIKSILKFTSEKKGDSKIIIGTGRASLKETIALSNYAEEMADKALVVPPFYFKELDSSGLYNYFKRLLEETRIPIILYNIPKYTGIPITPQLITKLKAYKNLVGVKDSSGKISTTEDFLQKCPNISVYAGSDALIYPSFEVGAQGVISAIANLFPKETLAIKKNFLNGDKAAAQAAQEKILEIRSIIKQFPYRGAIKYALSLFGYSLSCVRSPLVDLTEEQQGALKKQLKLYVSR